MAARAYWQGQIRLALVSIPVEIYPATKSGAKISFRQIHEPTGKPINYEKIVQGVGPVDRDEIVKGFETEKGHFVLLKDEEIEALKVESKKTLELVQFVDQHEIDVFYFEKPYYVVPADDLAEEAYIVLREALAQAKKVALGQLSVRGREQLVSLKPCGKGIILETLRYADEVRQARSYFSEIGNEKPSPELLDLATTLIEKKSAPFEAKKFHDNYIDAVRKLIDRKARSRGRNRTIIEEADESAGSRGSNVIDLMAALKKSVGDRKVPEKKPAAAKKPPAKPAPARRKRA